jgi:MFS family permease
MSTNVLQLEGDPADGAYHPIYPYYVLTAYCFVGVLSFVDRQIIATLAEPIKRDMQLSDASLGFLFGTAFSVFYAMMGIPLARIGDMSNRRNLIATGVGIWSAATALSSFARSFAYLAACRSAVGAAEASASPSIYSTLYDYFPPRVRTTIIGVYSASIYIGQGLGLFLGGAIVQHWAAAYPDVADAPLGLRGWQTAFLTVGAPGLMMAVWIATLREPRRAGVSLPARQAFREAAFALGAFVPGISLLLLGRIDARPVTVIRNVAAFALILAVAVALAASTRSWAQWMIVGAATYGAFTWTQFLARDHPVCHAMIFRSITMRSTIVANAAANFTVMSIAFWSIPFYLRFWSLPVSEVGAIVGGAITSMGIAGVVTGGLLSDQLRRWTPAGKLIIVLVSLLGSIVTSLLLLGAPVLRLSFVGCYMLFFFSSLGIGPCIATLNDLVLPENRATSSSFAFLVTYLFAGACGLYAVGFISDLFLAHGMSSGASLRLSLISALIVPLVGTVFAFVAIIHIGRDEAEVLDIIKNR